MKFFDLLYGEIELPSWVDPFLTLPEFSRLRGVGLSNITPVQLKDFGGPSRWSHSIGVAHLSQIASASAKLSEIDSSHLLIAALLHDVGTPPFAHTLEAVIPGFDHEINGRSLLSLIVDENDLSEFPVFAGVSSRFRELCEQASRSVNRTLDPDRIARIIVGDDERLGSFIKSTVDLDNIDNVVRASTFCGIKCERNLPERLAREIGTAFLERKPVGSKELGAWSMLRSKLYQVFSEDAQGDVALESLLQKLLRISINLGFGLDRVVWNTDARLLFDLEKFVDEYNESRTEQSTYDFVTCRDLLRRFNLGETAEAGIRQVFDSSQKMDWLVLSSPGAIEWLEREMSAECGPVSLIAKKSRGRSFETMFECVGAIFVFAQGAFGNKEVKLPSKSRKVLHRLCSVGLKERPWEGDGQKYLTIVKRNLDAVGDWGFRLSRNRPLHGYSSTFVHSLPACFLKVLELRGKRVLDPFGGTGQTCSEVAKHGGEGVSIDCNSVACLAARVKLSYLGPRLRKLIKQLTIDDLKSSVPLYPAEFVQHEKWFHAETFEQLAKIWGYVSKCSGLRDFYTLAFSSILTFCTARRGKNANYFADNTPLPKGQELPDFVDAYSLFLDRIVRNLSSIERFYADIEYRHGTPQENLRNIEVIRRDVRKLDTLKNGKYESYFDGVICSPPYLCMTDYTLGQRLSYQWIFPQRFASDLNQEIGARRSRTKSNAFQTYLLGMEKFAKQMSFVLKPKGYLAMVIGDSTAQRFSSCDPVEESCSLFETLGFERVWEGARPISWHTNGGRQALANERLFVFQKRG